MTAILFVCLGNICRSPTAEAVTRALAGTETQLTFDSAGTAGWHVGDAPYPQMCAAAQARGYALSGLRARQFSPRDFGQFSLIVAMDKANLTEVEAQRPIGATTPARRFTDFAPDTGFDHVPDPYYTRDFDQALDLVEVCARGLLSDLRSD